MEQEKKLEKELDLVIRNSMSSMTLFKRTSTEDPITDKQEALIFKLLEQEEVYLLDREDVVKKMKDKIINRREASAIICLLWGFVAYRSTFKSPKALFFTTTKGTRVMGEEESENLEEDAILENE